MTLEEALELRLKEEDLFYNSERMVIDMQNHITDLQGEDTAAAVRKIIDGLADRSEEGQYIR